MKVYGHRRFSKENIKSSRYGVIEILHDVDHDSYKYKIDEFGLTLPSSGGFDLRELRGSVTTASILLDYFKHDKIADNPLRAYSKLMIFGDNRYAD